MSLITLTFDSRYLHEQTNVRVLLPDEKFEQKAKVLWLLHGVNSDYTSWSENTSLVEKMKGKNVICVMPDAKNSYYEDWADGYHMKSYLIYELMPMIYEKYNASSEEKDNFIAGFSMGGAGALHYMLDFPGRFAAAASLAAAPRPLADKDWDNLKPNHARVVENAGGKEEYCKTHDYYEQIMALTAEGKLPRLYFAEGNEDKFFAGFSIFKSLCEQNNIPVRIHVAEGMAHKWTFVDAVIPNILEFFGL